jgi:hypothetical protein
MKAPLLIGVASFFTSAVLLLLLMQVPASAGWSLTILAYVAGAAVHGFAYGALLHRPCAVPVGWGSFAAACVASVPVVLVTYGAALAAAPVLVAFAAVVAASAHIGRSFGGARHAA